MLSFLAVLHLYSGMICLHVSFKFTVIGYGPTFVVPNTAIIRPFETLLILSTVRAIRKCTLQAELSPDNY